VNPNPYGGQKRAAGYVYVPRIYGFKVSDRAKCGPRMQWLRLRPETPEELDQVDWRGRWIDEDEYEDDEDEQDRQMEDFDPVCLTFYLLCVSDVHAFRTPEMMTTMRRRMRRMRMRAVRGSSSDTLIYPLCEPRCTLCERYRLHHGRMDPGLLYRCRQQTEGR
jgi:hypothetical protein